ncbi:HK97-gp10 family putative phage morphogenesis protein [Rossellomorea aquimaris]|uniref:HK97-gp10 family putative phage morphogenesis protein n=1 Tax=Rossellomorea aquimaris TaxID=189382 RepID=UPI0016537D76|nr:HK97-gp10 family putative phage morphogenesis protein [Rossellomorea aquimaris]
MKFKSNKKDVFKALNDAEKRVLLGIGEFAEGQAKSLAPVGQYDDGRVGGNLRGSITHQVNEGKRSVEIGTNVDYSIFVEKGTSRMSPQPYLTPAVEGNKEQIKALAERLFKL